jgi:hypothetical protein
MADLPVLDLLLFVAGTFAAALVTGVAGFAFGIVASAAWPGAVRLSVGIVLIIFSLYSLMRPQFAPLRAGKAATARSASSTASSAGRLGLPVSSSRSGAPCEDGRATSNARPFSRLAFGSFY